MHSKPDIHSSKPHSYPKAKILLLSSFYKWGNWGADRLNDLPKVIPLEAELRFKHRHLASSDPFNQITLLQRFLKNWTRGASLVAQWLRIHLPMQGTRVWALVQEDPTCHGATKSVHHSYWACALEPASHNYWACTLEPASHNYWSSRT